jgi:hypothetical protein
MRSAHLSYLSPPLWLQIKDALERIANGLKAASRTPVRGRSYTRPNTAMVVDLLDIASLFRATATRLRRLGGSPMRTKQDTIVAIEAYLHRGQIRSAPAFPPDQCKETANLLEEFAAKLEAICVRSRSGT